MKNNLLKIVIGLCLVAILLLSGCTSDQDQTNNNGEKNGGTNNGDGNGGGGTTSSSLPDFSDKYIPEMVFEEMWNEFNVPASLTRTIYHSDSNIDDIYDWYYSNRGDWEIKKRYKNEDPNNPGVTASAEIYFKHNDDSAYILLTIVDESMPIPASTILGIAEGSWTIVETCGTTTAEEDPYGIGTGSVEFSITPMDENDYDYVKPLGSVSGSSHSFPTDHGALLFKDPNLYPPSYDVVAPYDGVITEIRYILYDWPSGSDHSGKYNDYRIRMEHTNTFRGLIGHISELDESILSQTGELQVGGDTRFFDNPILVEEGQIIGKTGGRPGAQTGLDWWVVDEDIILNYIGGEDRYNQFVHATHFISYCEDELATRLIDKLGTGAPYYRKRTAEPLWGKVDFDESGKLVGNWFHEDVNPLDPMADFHYHLSFVYDMWDPSKIVIGVGGTLDITATAYHAVDNPTDPAAITTSSGQIVYKLTELEEFGSMQATILVEVVENDKIKVEGFSGHQSSPSFTSNAQYYIR